MKRYRSLVFVFLCVICVCGCKPSPKLGGSRRNAVVSSTNTLSPQVIEKIQKKYWEETGHTIKVIKVHEISTLGNKILAKIIIERERKKYLTMVDVEYIDGIPVVDVLYLIDKEIE